MDFDLEWKVSDMSVWDFVRLINLLENLISPFFKRKEKLNFMTYEMFQMMNLKNLEGKSMSSVGDSLVKHFQSQEDDWDLKILEELCSLKLLERPNKSNHVFFFLKMLKAYSITIRDGRSPQSLPRLMSWGLMLSGRCLTVRILAFPKTERGCLLSDILERKVPDSYFLSDEKVKQLTLRLFPEPIQFLKVREATKKGYAQAESGDSINLERPSSQYRRGRVGKGIANTLTTSGQMGVVVASYEGEDKQVYQVAGVLIDGQFYRLRIRRITPKECFRLQGFPDWAFEAARKVSSNSQLYKQAGNSVTVPVIAAIAKKLKEVEEKDESIK